MILDFQVVRCPQGTQPDLLVHQDPGVLEPLGSLLVLMLLLFLYHLEDLLVLLLQQYLVTQGFLGVLENQGYLMPRQVLFHPVLLQAPLVPWLQGHPCSLPPLAPR